MKIKKIVSTALIFGAFYVTSVSSATYTWTMTLKQGMKNEEVRTLQKFLNMYPQWQVATTGAGSPGYESTTFGTLTKNAVIKFQQSNPPLKADGIFGPASQSVAYKIQDAPTTTTTCTGSTTQSCTVSNGTGTQSRMCTNGVWSTWSSCLATSCNTGYALTNGQCVQNTTTTTPVSTTLIPTGASWKYLDNGTNQGTAWKELSFNDSTWATGNAELGYGDGDETKVVSYGSNSSSKYITTYFRKSFSINDLSSITGLNLAVKRDDGVVVYLNGVELVRNNLPTGTIYYNTLATDASDDGKTFLSYSVPQSALVVGNNVVAVEIHQSSITSSDISFDLSLSTIVSSTSTTTPEYYFNDDYTDSTLSGTGSTRTISNWNILGATSYLDSAYAWEYKPPFTNISMVDNCDSGRRCLRLDTIDDDPNTSGTTRTQYEMTFKSGTSLPVYRTSQRMYLSPDLAYLQNYSGKINWMDIWETWLAVNPNWDGDTAGSARMSLYINKDSAVGSPLYWELTSEYMQPEAVKFVDIWPTQTNTTPIPFGKWFTLDVMVVNGVGSQGRIKIDMTPDGGPTTTLFDVRNTTTYVRDGISYPELYRQRWHAYKFYFGDTILDWLAANGKKAYALYNDFKWYKN
jgi:hypothetical protein